MVFAVGAFLPTPIRTIPAFVRAKNERGTEIFEHHSERESSASSLAESVDTMLNLSIL
jgi:hypothetical protein